MIFFSSIISSFNYIFILYYDKFENQLIDNNIKLIKPKLLLPQKVIEFMILKNYFIFY
jgi:hypothetical protein